MQEESWGLLPAWSLGGFQDQEGKKGAEYMKIHLNNTMFTLLKKYCLCTHRTDENHLLFFRTLVTINTYDKRS